MRLLPLSLAKALCLVSLSGIIAPAAGFAATASADVLARLPLRFEAVESQKWIARGPGFGVAFTQQGSFMQLGDRGLRLTLPGADRHAKLEGLDKSSVPTNYFGKPFRSADAFGRLRQAGVYPGINLVYYGKGQSLEYDFELAPGADPSLIRMRFEGADTIRLGSRGQLILGIGKREVTQNPPVVYQRRASGETVGVSSWYVPQEDGSIGIALGTYDARQALVVDPTVLFTDYLAGTSADVPVGIGHDVNGSIYIAGYTYSPDFVLVGQPYTDFFLTGAQQAFTTVMNPLGSQDNVITYSGFFSGTFGDNLTAMTVDSNGVFYLAGFTDDFNFPVTAGAYLAANGGVRRSFISVVDPRIPGTDGLTYSTFFAGTMTDQPTGIAVAGGKIYVTGFTTSDDYPVTANAFQSTRPGGSFDGFLAELDPTQSGTASLISSTYLGGSGQDVPRSIAVAADGQAYVAGYTRSIDFPTTPNSFRPFYSGSGDGFLTRIDMINNVMTYSTYLGGSGQDQATKILVEPSGHVAIAGYTLSVDYPVTGSALQNAQGGNGDVFLTILDPGATDFNTALVYSTYFGGSDGDVPYDLRRDAAGKYYLCGYTLSLDLPVTPNALSPASYPGNSIDGFVAVIDPAAAPLKGLVYSSHVTGPGYQVAYGVDVDAQGNIYLTGTALGDVFGGTGAHPPDNSNLNVFLLVFQL
ncbi:MAG TPA: SBBP repeat-containing protein [Bryobacteraceae bacterium]